VSREDFVAVAARLLSIYILFGILQGVPSALQVMFAGQDVAWGALFAFFLALGALLCAFLWFFPLTVARKLLPVMSEPRSEEAIDASIALSLGLTLLGAWFFANALIDTSYWLVYLFRSRQVEGGALHWSHEQVAHMVATVVELVVALWLLLGSGGIKRLIYKFRRGDA
jgi:hypothetical protein